jgi:hypothetical protein
LTRGDDKHFPLPFFLKDEDGPRRIGTEDEVLGKLLVKDNTAKRKRRGSEEEAKRKRDRPGEKLTV